jgi:uncharacterized OB-fold protein
MEDAKTYPPFEVKQRIRANSLYYAGKMGSLFYVNLRDQEVIVGAKCPKCNKVFWPPRSTCGLCFSELTEVVKIGPLGTVETFTLVTYSEPMHSRQAPFVFGVIKLDGADTGITHFIDETEYEKIHIGMRVQSVFAKERKGNILDILYFKPI